MGKLENSLWKAGFIGYVGALFLFIGSTQGWFGYRGENNVYSFKYKGEPARVIRKDMRFAKDKYEIVIGKDRLVGTLVSDDGKEISVKDKYIHLVKNGRYLIREEEQ